MMKCCPKCNGRGKTTEYDGLRKFWCDYKCEMCNGTGEVLTEQEWLQTCDTEQLAEWFTNSGFLPCGLRGCDDCKYYDKNNDDCDFNFYGSINHKKMWLEWLKQPHTTKE